MVADRALAEEDVAIGIDVGYSGLDSGIQRVAVPAFQVVMLVFSIGVVVTAAQQGIKTLMVVSAVAGEGKTTTLVNLAIAMASAGKGLPSRIATRRSRPMPIGISSGSGPMWC